MSRSRKNKGFAKLFRVNHWNFKGIDTRTRGFLKKAVAQHANIIQSAIRMDMRKPKTGRIYRIRGRLHRASAPGESPAILTGDLYRRIEPRFSDGGMQFRINAGKISKFLEFGTKSKSGKWRIKPRPHIVPFFEKQRPIFHDHVRHIIKTAIKPKQK